MVYVGLGRRSDLHRLLLLRRILDPHQSLYHTLVSCSVGPQRGVAECVTRTGEWAAHTGEARASPLRQGSLAPTVSNR